MPRPLEYGTERVGGWGHCTVYSTTLHVFKRLGEAGAMVENEEIGG